MSSQKLSQNSKSVSKKQILLEELNDFQSQMAELMKKLNLLEKQPKKITLFVLENKEEIAAKKTQKQLEVEKNSPLFKRKNISDDKLYHPYRSGIQTNEKRYTDMFNYVLLPREGRREGKVKYINECLNLDNFKNSLKESKNDSSSVKKSEKKKDDKKEKDDKIIFALNKKKINDLRISARDMKIKNYSVMKKEELVNSIYNILKRKEFEKEEKENKEKEEKENKEKESIKNITKKSKSELLKECGVDDSVEYDENDLNGNNDENLFYDDDDCHEDSVDYE
jgi:hypothetical protein